jgi:hypothetical protein
MSVPSTGAIQNTNPFPPSAVVPSSPAATPAGPAPLPNAAPPVITPPLRVAKTVAVFPLSGGGELKITEADMVVDPNLSPDQRIRQRYQRLQALVGEFQAQITELNISDPELLIMYQLEMISAGPLDDTFVKQLDGLVKQTPLLETKAYFKFIVAEELFNKGRIQSDELRRRLEEVISLGVEDVRFYDLYAQVYAGEGKEDKAAMIFARYLRSQFSSAVY